MHISVLLNESIDSLNIKQDGIYVDCTLGGAGHSYEILKKLTTGHLYCFDQDSYAIEKANQKLSTLNKDNYTIIKSNFVNLKQELNELNVTKVDGILYDLGVSSFQFDIPDRGFSYNYDAHLDMRMNQDSSLTAHEIVNNYSMKEIANILFHYADESNSFIIAKAIEKRRAIKPIDTTFELVDVIKSSLPEKVKRKKGHPAKKTFQALRIAVNDELQVFEKSLLDAIDLLDKEGVVSVITFHSIEDRICKTIFKQNSTIQQIKGLPVDLVTETKLRLEKRKPILPTDEELAHNNRAHSAKLRYAIKN